MYTRSTNSDKNHCIRRGVDAKLGSTDRWLFRDLRGLWFETRESRNATTKGKERLGTRPPLLRNVRG